MKWSQTNYKESVNIYQTLAVLVVTAGVFIEINCHPGLRAYVAKYADLRLLEWASHGLFLWMIAVLWVAYRRWRVVTIEKADLETVVDSIQHDVVMVVTPDRKIVACNEAAKNVFGHDPEVVLNKTTDFLYFDRRQKAGQGREIFEQIEQIGYHVGFASGRKADGTVFPLEIFTGKLKDRRGTVILLCDITERIEAENQLKAAKETAERAHKDMVQAHEEKSAVLAQLQENYKQLVESEQARDSLTHMIVHDMKVPLQVIRGYMELVMKKLERGDTNIDKEFIQDSLDQTHHLVSMVHSLLDISRLESNEMPLELADCDLRAAAQRAIDSMGTLDRDCRVSLNVTGETVSADCDVDIISRVLTNLLSNAAKYSPDGGTIEVHVNLEDDERARIDVIDEGPGIPEEFLETVFEKFGRVNKAEYKRPSSTGLGLAFCKLAVEAHQGEIGLESELGKGCRFWFALPANVANRMQPAA